MKETHKAGCVPMVVFNFKQDYTQIKTISFFFFFFLDNKIRKKKKKKKKEAHTHYPYGLGGKGGKVNSTEAMMSRFSSRWALADWMSHSPAVTLWTASDSLSVHRTVPHCAP